jgi:hypothetical protein
VGMVIERCDYDTYDYWRESEARHDTMSGLTSETMLPGNKFTHW